MAETQSEERGDGVETAEGRGGRRGGEGEGEQAARQTPRPPPGHAILAGPNARHPPEPLTHASHSSIYLNIYRRTFTSLYYSLPA